MATQGNGGVGINVGDAVLNFVADTTSLDQSYAKIQSEAPQKLAPVKAAAEQVGQSMVVAGEQSQAATTKMISGFQAVTREGQSWANFFKVNMPAAVAYTGSATEAMKLLGVEWRKFQATQTDGFHAITREGELWAGFFKANIEKAIAYTGSATEAMKLLGAEWQKQKAAIASNTVEIEKEITAVKELAAVTAAAAESAVTAPPVTTPTGTGFGTMRTGAFCPYTPADAAATAAAGEQIIASENEVAAASERVGEAAAVSGEQVAKSATMWQKLMAVLTGVLGVQSDLAASTEKTTVAQTEEAAATDKQATAMQKYITAQLEAATAQAVVKEILSAISKGELPQTTASAEKLAYAMKDATIAAEKLAVAEAEAFGPKTSASILERRGEVMALSRELGLGTDRYLAGWISRLPIVGAALEAAFSATMVLILVQLLVEGIEKLEEWRDRSEKIREAWVEINEGFARTTDDIKSNIDDQEQKFIELTEGPVAGLDFALKHLKSTAQDSLQSLSADVKKAAEELKSENSLLDIFQSVSPKDASKDLTKFITDLTEGMRKAKEAAPNDLFAQYREGQRLTEERIRTVNGLIDAEKEAIKAVQQQQLVNGGIIDSSLMSKTILDLQKELEILNKVNSSMKDGIDLDKERQKVKEEEEAKAAAQRAQELGSASIDAEKSKGEAILALQREENVQYFQQGRRSFEQYIALVRKYADDEYALNKNSLQQKRALLAEDPTKNAAALITVNGQLRALEVTHQTELLKIDQEAYRKRAGDVVAAVQQQIAATKQGSDERINLERALGVYLKAFWGEESDAYKAQLKKISEAERQHTDLLAQLAVEQARVQKQLFDDRIQAQRQFVQYETQTNRVTQAEALTLQHQLDLEAFNQRRAELTKQLKELSADELGAKIRLQGQLDLLDQQQIEAERQYRRQLADVQDSYFQQLGIKSEDQVRREVDVEQQAFDKIEQSGVASYTEILRAKEALLNSKISLAQLLGDEAEFQKLTAQLAEVENALYKMGVVGSKSYTSIAQAMDAFVQRLIKERGELHGTQAVFNTVMLDMTNAMAGAVQAWILGQQSLGQALRQGLAAELATIAGKAAAWALYFTAWGIADIFWNPGRAAADFTAAATFAAVAALAGAAAYAIRPSTNNQGVNPADTQQASGVTQGPTAGQNTQRLGTGGVVTKRQLVQIGDDKSGTADSPEAVIPLQSPEALKSIADALGPYVTAQAALLSTSTRSVIDQSSKSQRDVSSDRVTNNEGDEVHYHDNRSTSVVVQGMISDDKMVSVVRKINRLVKRNDVQLTSSNALRVTKRS